MLHQYAKASADTCESFGYARGRLGVTGVAFSAGSSAVGVLSIKTGQAIKPDLLGELGLIKQAE